MGLLQLEQRNPGNRQHLDASARDIGNRRGDQQFNIKAIQAPHEFAHIVHANLVTDGDDDGIGL